MQNTIIVTEEDRDVLQRADIECAARMNLISFMIKNDIGITNARFQEYQDDYTQFFFAFENAKKDMENKYLAGKTYTSWSLDYNTCQLTYEA